MKGKVFNIQRFCTQDGPGIRTVVFFKGCPLRCAWCHNPESHFSSVEIMYNSEKCVGCQRCVAVCPNKCHSFKGNEHLFERRYCTACGACSALMCDALELKGSEMTVEQVLDEVMKDELFYKSSGGGMTLSGGEPLLQGEFCTALLREAKARGIDTCIETCGYAARDIVKNTALWIDTYLFDVKETDSQRHKQYTGVDNGLILENLALLDALKKRVVLRCPIIPGINDREDHFRAIAELANRLSCIQRVEVAPYHAMGADKYKHLGRDYTVSAEEPRGDAVDNYVAAISRYTTVKIVRS